MLRPANRPDTSTGRLMLLPIFLLVFVSVVSGQEAPRRSVYEQLRTLEFKGGSATASNLTLKRDRVEMTFDGTFHFASPVQDRITCAVFRGKGKLTAPVQASLFEQDNLRRMLNSDKVESEFQSAVLIFADDTFKTIGQGVTPGEAPPEVAKLAVTSIARSLQETGANYLARTALAIVNEESPGFFIGKFEGGALGSFSYVLDPQCRIPVSSFNVNAGEKGLIFRYNRDIFSPEILMAFYSLEDYARRQATYSDQYDIVDVENYEMTADLRAPERLLRLRAKLLMKVLAPTAAGVPFTIGENLSVYNDSRLKKQMRVRSAKVGSEAIPVVQEDWEKGFTIFPGAALSKGQSFTVELELEGDFMTDSNAFSGCHYPTSNAAWYPRHGYLDRATYDLTYIHRKKNRVASSGIRTAEKPDADSKDDVITSYRLDQPVSLVTFAIGPWQRHPAKIKWERGGETQLELNSLPGSQVAIKEDFILAELDNAVRFFAALFGDYPYPQFGAVVHPYGFGQGFATMLTIPPTDRASKHVYSFVSHETAHQWWGNIVAWRSYQDQWLSEGFAEYSGLLYTAKRDSGKSMRELINEMRDQLKDVPVTTVGVGKGRLYDVGPIILGHRLNTSKTYGAYQALIYSKGALVLRMLHFLFTNPANGDGQPFFTMMTDFVNRHRNGSASSDDFRAVANEHFAKTPLARKYQLQDLNWFFVQWIYGTAFPSYRLEYQLADQGDGSVMLTGTVFQDNAPDSWFMPLPLVMEFPGNQQATGTVSVLGKQSPVNLKLPKRPTKVTLDPHAWVLADKTETKGR